MNDKKQVMELIQRTLEAEKEAIDKGFELVKWKVDVNIAVGEVKTLISAIREDVAEMQGSGFTHVAFRSFWENIGKLEAVIKSIEQDYLEGLNHETF